MSKTYFYKVGETATEIATGEIVSIVEAYVGGIPMARVRFGDGVEQERSYASLKPCLVDGDWCRDVDGNLYRVHASGIHLRAWLVNGGAETGLSYGIEESPVKGFADTFTKCEDPGDFGGYSRSK